MSKIYKKQPVVHEGMQFCLPQHLSYLSRRELMRSGVSLTAFLGASQLLGIKDARANLGQYVPQRRLIWINMRGGWDILEVTDPKPSSTSGIDMSFTWGQAHDFVDGHRLGRWLPQVASIGDQMLVIRGIAMGTTSHEAGTVYMDTGVLSNAGRVNAASIPAIVASESMATIPMIQLNGGSEPMIDRGLLNPVSVVRAQNLNLYRGMYPQSEHERELRMRILDYVAASVDRLSSRVGVNDRLAAIATAEQKIRGQIEDDVASNLSLTEEDVAPYLDSSQPRQGRNIAESFALAAKLIKNDLVTCVNLGIGGYDTHSNQEPRLMPILQTVNRVLPALVEDLSLAGALDDTLIVCYSDFGRTPKINNSNGRDHWPVGGALMIGGGIEGGRVVGDTDDYLRALSVNPVSGQLQTDGEQISPSHLGGSVLSLCLGSSYDYRVSYLPPMDALTRLRDS